jgi:hypothetical protein
MQAGIPMRETIFKVPPLFGSAAKAVFKGDTETVKTINTKIRAVK